ncbi:glycoprotein 3-alpha-L-fucosyltransferase [Marine Group I thaumarchaeote SCGC AAA799-B03]|uniref:Glycoprotein 3-alpha-L-fucosyltransferase n=1 Tax=Marine Group I thaumarchaeote SCGC AAA799-B03 TaxID=1502289 RepID=A0A087S905_9ARCH|nr:glycoprotein 3-alpha-L-fucosyltransferase [Marine Group I thaumarchaeote SCGC AAA799-B03]
MSNLYPLGKARIPNVVKEKLPTISFVIPTYNSEKYMQQCLESITIQKYPQEMLEIIIADGGSRDKTLEIAKKFDVTIVNNKLKTAEAGKAVGAKLAKNEIVAFVDSDNILPEDTWLLKMTYPFVMEKDISATEPIYYTYRKKDPPLTRYCALIGMNDPLCLFLGNYDRYNAITNKWTSLKIDTKDMEDYLKINLNIEKIPTIGANGFLVKKELIKEINEYLFDVDLIHDLVIRGHNKIAKVKVGIIHLFGTGKVDFKRKQTRRIRDYNYYNKMKQRNYPWIKTNYLKIFKFAFFTVLGIPIIYQIIKGHGRIPDTAWRFHFSACWITLTTYVKETIIKAKSEKEVLATRN